MPDHYATTPAKRRFLKELLKALPGNSGRVQCIRMLEALRHGPITTNEARRFLDVFDPASRVRDLRHRFGFEISTNWWESDTERGVRHRVGQYHLMSEKGASL